MRLWQDTTLDRIKFCIMYMKMSQEYEEGKSAEAIIVKDLDMFDMIFQAFEYEKGEVELVCGLICAKTGDSYDKMTCMHNNFDSSIL